MMTRHYGGDGCRKGPYHEPPCDPPIPDDMREKDHTPRSYKEGEVFTRDDPNHIGFGDQWRKTKAGWEFIGNAQRGTALSPLSTRHFA